MAILTAILIVIVRAIAIVMAILKEMAIVLLLAEVESDVNN